MRFDANIEFGMFGFHVSLFSIHLNKSETGYSFGFSLIEVVKDTSEVDRCLVGVELSRWYYADGGSWAEQKIDLLWTHLWINQTDTKVHEVMNLIPLEPCTVCKEPHGLRSVDGVCYSCQDRIFRITMGTKLSLFFHNLDDIDNVGPSVLEEKLSRVSKKCLRLGNK